MSETKGTRFQINKIKNLPPLPEASVRILSAVNDPGISVDALVSVISLSPVLVARLLGLANSSYFGWAGHIEDLGEAIVKVLGLNLVKSLSLSIVLNLELDASKCKLFDSNLFWNNALLTALIAQKLALFIKAPLPPFSVIYTSGLLLNIGVLAAIHISPAILNEVFSKTEEGKSSVSEQMHLSFGITQYEMGGMLLERWKLPEVYQTAVKQFQQADYEGEEKVLLDLLYLSHGLAKLIVSDEKIDSAVYSDVLNRFSLSARFLDNIISDVIESKEKISEMAVNISH